MPGLAAPLISAALVVASGVAVMLSDAVLKRGGRWTVAALVLLALGLLGAGMGLDLRAIRDAGVGPTFHAFGAAIFVNQFWQLFHLGIMGVMALYLVARIAAGMVDRVRRVTFDVVRLFWFYVVGQALAGLALSHLFPRGAGVA